MKEAFFSEGFNEKQEHHSEYLHNHLVRKHKIFECHSGHVSNSRLTVQQQANGPAFIRVVCLLRSRLLLFCLAGSGSFWLSFPLSTSFPSLLSSLHHDFCLQPSFFFFFCYTLIVSTELSLQLEKKEKLRLVQLVTFQCKEFGSRSCPITTAADGWHRVSCFQSVLKPHQLICPRK